MKPRQVLSLDQIDLSAFDFWERPLEEREGAFNRRHQLACPVAATRSVIDP